MVAALLLLSGAAGLWAAEVTPPAVGDAVALPGTWVLGALGVAFTVLSSVVAYLWFQVQDLHRYIRSELSAHNEQLGKYAATAMTREEAYRAHIEQGMRPAPNDSNLRYSVQRPTPKP